MVDLASLLENTERRIDPNAWTSICNGLSIDSTGADEKGIKIQESKISVKDPKIKTKHERRREKLIRNGFALVDESFDVQKVREGIEQLHVQNLPATFILLFDEAWQLACQSKHVLEQASHTKNVFNYDLLAWYIKPGSPGFSPHRDRQPDDAPSTFHSDEQAKFITNWIALSDATPENSCLYMIPKPYDPGYTSGDIDSVADDKDGDKSQDGEKENGNADPLHRALSTKEKFQHIRCLPRKAGQSILFTHRIVHWGSQSDPVDQDQDDAEQSTSTSTISPRIAISFVCSDPDYEAPLLVNHKNYFSIDSDSSGGMPRFPPLQIRLLLVCAQLLIYYQRFNLEKAVIKACYDYCKQNEEELEEGYRRKVFVEFVNAMKEHNETDKKDTGNKNIVSASTTFGNQAPSSSIQHFDPSGSHKVCDDDDDDDDEDAMLEEMLNAEAGGYGEFEDDYDELEEDDDCNGSEDDLEEEGVDLFGGKRRNEDTTSFENKKIKTFIS